MASSIPALPPQDSTSWYAHYSGVDAAARELQTLLGSSMQENALNGCLASTMSPTVCGSQGSTAASTTYGYKMFTPQSITATYGVVITGSTAGAGTSGYYMALYDSTGAYYSGSVSADFSTPLNTASAYAAATFGTPPTIPAGFFYLLLRSGTATTQPTLRGPSFPPAGVVNAGLTSTTVGSTAPRQFTPGNAWSGATPPTTLGTLSATSFNMFVGVK